MVARGGHLNQSFSSMTYTVLVVDDDEMVRTSLEVALNLEGYRVRTAEGGQAALESLESVSADLVVLDISMPDLDGWETIRRLRGNPSSAALPVVALSGDQLEAHQLRRAGFNAYLSKGSSLDQFLCTVRSAIENSAGSTGMWLHACNGRRCLVHPPTVPSAEVVTPFPA
jgi:two-component system response regulator MprA